MKSSTFFLACAAALLLAGCGGGGGDGSSPGPEPDPLAVYKNQTVKWGSCSQYFSDTQIRPDIIQYLAILGNRVQCADVKAPLDYQKPDGLQISLAMLRVQAADSPDKKPHLFFNPGGPGQDGQKNSLLYSMLLANGNADSALGRKYREMSDSYNFVGFSPRGVGASTNILCAGTEFVYKTDASKWGEQPENIRRLNDSARFIAGNCQKNPISDYVHTDATARDMDLMRHLLGDEKLHYYGVSYGTWLGFWYAGVFPERVGPMVLDSNMNFNRSIHEASISYVDGQILTFREHMAPYAARHDDIFGMGTSAASIIDELNAIGHEVNLGLLDIGGDFRVEEKKIPYYIASIKAALETQKLIEQGKTLDEIEAILTSGTYIADAKIEEAFKEQAERMVNSIRSRMAPDFYNASSFFELDNADSVWNTVVCNDEPMWNKDQMFWVNTAFRLARSLPIASIKLASQPCLYWDRKTNAAKPSMDSLKNAPLLMVQSQYDVPTPLAGAMETFDKLPAVSMVRIRNEGAHGIMVYQTECVDLTVMDYLLGKAPSQRLTECQGKPLRFDDALPQSDVFKSSQAVGAPPASNFEDPGLAESLLSQLREAVGR